MMPVIVLLTVGSALSGWWLTRWVLRHAPLDHPTIRSSHDRPTPRGGGLAIVMTTLLGTAAGVALGRIDAHLGLALGGGGLLVAAVGWLDDRAGVPPRLRIGAHALAAVWALWWLGGLPMIMLGPARVELGVAGSVLGLAGIVWAINLFNFMDGIDGIAGVEASCLGLGAALLLARHGVDGGAVVPLLIAGSSFGFLAWNWAPARIFLGDVGSGFLGFVFAILAIWSEDQAGPSIISWAVLSMVFILDATVTLIRRGLRRERVTEGHRHHAYQRLVQAGWSHSAVTCTVLGLNVVLFGAALLPPLSALAVAIVLCGVSYLLVGKVRPM